MRLEFSDEILQPAQELEAQLCHPHPMESDTSWAQSYWGQVEVRLPIRGRWSRGRLDYRSRKVGVGATAGKCRRGVERTGNRCRCQKVAIIRPVEVPRCRLKHRQWFATVQETVEGVVPWHLARTAVRAVTRIACICNRPVGSVSPSCDDHKKQSLKQLLLHRSSPFFLIAYVYSQVVINLEQLGCETIHYHRTDVLGHSYLGIPGSNPKGVPPLRNSIPSHRAGADEGAPPLPTGFPWMGEALHAEHPGVMLRCLSKPKPWKPTP